eukprot:scaffold119901_cov28-Tisochrysis_lutea.AAC.1
MVIERFSPWALAAARRGRFGGALLVVVRSAGAGGGRRGGQSARSAIHDPIFLTIVGYLYLGKDKASLSRGPHKKTTGSGSRRDGRDWTTGHRQCGGTSAEGELPFNILGVRAALEGKDEGRYGIIVEKDVDGRARTRTRAAGLSCHVRGGVVSHD